MSLRIGWWPPWFSVDFSTQWVDAAFPTGEGFVLHTGVVEKVDWVMSAQLGVDLKKWVCIWVGMKIGLPNPNSFCFFRPIQECHSGGIPKLQTHIIDIYYIYIYIYWYVYYIYILVSPHLFLSLLYTWTLKLPEAISKKMQPIEPTSTAHDIIARANFKYVYPLLLGETPKWLHYWQAEKYLLSSFGFCHIVLRGLILACTADDSPWINLAPLQLTYTLPNIGDAGRLLSSKHVW